MTIVSLGDLLEGLLGDGDWSPKQKIEANTELEYSTCY